MNNPRMGQISRTIGTEAIATTLKLFTGERPIVEKYDDYTDIKFTSTQQEKIEGLLTKWHSREPGEIRVDVKSVLLPFYLKKYGLLIGGIAAGSLITGFLLSKVFSK